MSADKAECLKLADRLGSLSMGSCTCEGVTARHQDSCPTKIIHDCCSYLRALPVAFERYNQERRRGQT